MQCSGALEASSSALRSAWNLVFSGRKTQTSYDVFCAPERLQPRILCSRALRILPERLKPYTLFPESLKSCIFLERINLAFRAPGRLVFCTVERLKPRVPRLSARVRNAPPIGPPKAPAPWEKGTAPQW